MTIVEVSQVFVQQRAETIQQHNCHTFSAL